MSELVIDALPEIEQGAEIDLARIYLYAVQRKMDRDVSAERTFTSRGDKLLFLCEVAWEMLSTNRLTLNYRDFPDRLRSCFGSTVQSAKDLDYWEQDMRNQGMLVRNAEGDYGPSHKSLLEFLVALKFAAELGLLSGDFMKVIPAAGAAEAVTREWTWSRYFAARAEDGTLPPLGEFVAEPVEALGTTFGAFGRDEAVYQFLSAMVRECPDHRERLLALAGSTAGLEAEAGNLAGNCLNLLVLCGGSLERTRLAGLDLAGFAPRQWGSGFPSRARTCVGPTSPGRTWRVRTCPGPISRVPGSGTGTCWTTAGRAGACSTPAERWSSPPGTRCSTGPTAGWTPLPAGWRRAAAPAPRPSTTGTRRPGGAGTRTADCWWRPARAG